MSAALQSVQDLNQFTGTEMWTRWGLNSKMLCTDGVMFFAENAGNGAYWFVDIVATELMQLHREHPFIDILMTVVGERAEIEADDGNGNTLWSRVIAFTDCPEGVWHFYLTDNTMLLPSEY